MELVAEEGFEGFSINRLAGELDVAAGGLYRYFPSKDALIATLTGRAVEQLSEELQGLRQSWAARLPEDAAEAALCELVAGARWYGELPSRRRTLFSLVAQSMAHTGFMIGAEALEPVAVPFRALLGQLESMFAAAEQSGALPVEDALQRSLVLWSALHGGLLIGKFHRLWPERTDAFAVVARQQLLVAGLLRGWGADEQLLRRALAWTDEAFGEGSGRDAGGCAQAISG